MRTRVVTIALNVGLVLAVGCLGVSTGAKAAVYWGGGTFIGAANIDGTMPVISYPYEVANLARKGTVCGLAVDAGRIYWADQWDGTIGAMDLVNTPSGRPAVNEWVWMDRAFVSGLASPCGIAVSQQHLYWADTEGFAIGRANRDGTGVVRNFIAGVQTPCGVAVDASHIYWAERDEGTIGRARLDGSESDSEFISGAMLPCGLAVDSTHLYWADIEATSIGRARLDGSGVEPNWIDETGGAPCGVAVDGSRVFWGYGYRVGSQLGTAALDGAGAHVLVNVGPYAASCGAAVDARVFQSPFAATPPSRPFHVGKAKRMRRSRQLMVPVYVPERGELSVISPQIGWRLDKGPEPPPWRGGQFRWKLTLWPGRGKMGKRIRRQLRRGRPAPINLHLSYQEAGRTPAAGSERLIFRDTASRKKRKKASRAHRR